MPKKTPPEPQQKTAAPKEKATTPTQSRELFVVATSASTPDGPLTPGEIAEAGSKILKAYPALFRPLAITYKA